MNARRHTPGTHLTDAELRGLVVAVARSLDVLGTQAAWASRSYCLALAAEMAWRGIEGGNV